MKFVMFNGSIHFVAHVSYSLSENKKHFITCRLSQCLLQITRFFCLLSNRLWVILPETIVQWCYLYKTKTKSLIKHDMLVYSYSLLLRETSLLPQWYALTVFFYRNNISEKKLIDIIITGNRNLICLSLFPTLFS